MLQDKYGADRVAQIATLRDAKAKAAIRIGRAPVFPSRSGLHCQLIPAPKQASTI